ncbi:hypothetical protein ACSBR2_016157 [Camellia fascicularis]
MIYQDFLILVFTLHCMIESVQKKVGDEKLRDKGSIRMINFGSKNLKDLWTYLMGVNALRQQENTLGGKAILALGTNRFLAQSPRVTMKCYRYPRVCALKGSLGRDCCNKQCVNCGKKCKYSEMCCGGECANPSVDEKHCGNCNMKCKNEGSCVYGMCSYDY